MTHHIAKQVHTRFKVFSGELNADGTIGKLADEIAAFAGKTKIAPKSIGVAHLEDARRVVITLGYRDDEEPYPIKLHCVSIGKMDLKGNDLSALEKPFPKQPETIAISSATNFISAGRKIL